MAWRDSPVCIFGSLERTLVPVSFVSSSPFLYVAQRLVFVSLHFISIVAPSLVSDASLCEDGKAGREPA